MNTPATSGPHKVAAAASRFQQCPHMAEYPAAITSMTATRHEAERLRKFGLAKLVTDGLAARLPNMTNEYPPYGLPVLQGSYGMRKPEWYPVKEIRPDYDMYVADPLKAVVGKLHGYYSSKLIVHTYRELEAMSKEDQYKTPIQALAEFGKRAYMTDDVATIEGAYELTGRPAVDNSDIIFGLVAVIPGVLEAKLGREPTHTEVISTLKQSRRLPIIGSLLAREQLMPFLIGTTVDNNSRPTRWGFNFDPAKFEARDSGAGFVVDYAGGLGTLAVPEYKLDQGEFGHAYMPEVKIDSSQSARPLAAIALSRETLTCPSRNMITAIWKDVTEISDQTSLFDRSSISV